MPATKWLDTEVKAADAHRSAGEASQRVDELQQLVDELQAKLAEAQTDNEAMVRVLDATDLHKCAGLMGVCSLLMRVRTDAMHPREAAMRPYPGNPCQRLIRGAWAETRLPGLRKSEVWVDCPERAQAVDATV